MQREIHDRKQPSYLQIDFSLEGGLRCRVEEESGDPPPPFLSSAPSFGTRLCHVVKASRGPKRGTTLVISVRRVLDQT